MGKVCRPLPGRITPLKNWPTHPAYLQNSDHASLCANSARLVAVVSLSSSATLIGFTHPHPSAGALILLEFFVPQVGYDVVAGGDDDENLALKVSVV